MDSTSCDHLWMLEKTEQYLSMYSDRTTHIAWQKFYYCQRDPTHTLTIPTDKELHQLDRELFDMRYEFSKEYFEDLKIANSF